MGKNNFDWKEFVFVDFPKLKEVTRRMVYGLNSLLMRGSCRIMNNRLSTSKDLEERRKRALRPLSEI